MLVGNTFGYGTLSTFIGTKSRAVVRRRTAGRVAYIRGGIICVMLIFNFERSSRNGRDIFIVGSEYDDIIVIKFSIFWNELYFYPVRNISAPGGGFEILVAMVLCVWRRI